MKERPIVKKRMSSLVVGGIGVGMVGLAVLLVIFLPPLFFSPTTNESSNNESSNTENPNPGTIPQGTYDIYYRSTREYSITLGRRPIDQLSLKENGEFKIVLEFVALGTVGGGSKNNTAATGKYRIEDGKITFYDVLTHIPGTPTSESWVAEGTIEENKIIITEHPVVWSTIFGGTWEKTK